MDNSPETNAGLPRKASASRFGRSGSAGDSAIQKGGQLVRLPQTVTAVEIAQLIGRSVDTVYRREKLGILPQRIQDGGNPIIWNLCDILEYMESIGLKAS